jgi:hypothetical protein
MATKSMCYRSRLSPWIGDSQRTPTKNSLRKRETSCCACNAASRVRDSVQRLEDALDVRFDELRPGVLLSRVRSLEADRAAYDTEEARAELFPDALARIDDTVQSGRDLLAVFPKVRQIEAERLALDLDRRPDVLPVIEQQANEIQDAAQRSGAATENAVRALAQNDAAINAATNNSVLRTSLIADKLLVIGNFARAAAGKVWSELSELGADSWEAVKGNLPKGIGTAAHVGPLMALMTLAMLIAGPVAGVASAVPAWKPFSRVFKKMVGEDAKNLGRMPRQKPRSARSSISRPPSGASSSKPTTTPNPSSGPLVRIKSSRP